MTDKTVRGRNGNLSYRYVAGKSPCVLFMHGTLSDKNASKSLFFEQLCRETGQAYCAFDFTGHGESDGIYTDGTIGVWLDDALTVIDDVIKAPVVLIGSSMGGWIMLLAAMRRKCVRGCLGLAAAPDFTVGLWESFSEKQKQSVLSDGVVYIPNGWTPEGDPWTKALFDDAEKYLVLNGKISGSCPMILIQGDKDDCVAVDTPFKIKDVVLSDDVTVIVLKNAGHRLSEPRELETAGRALSLLLKKSAG